MNKIYGVDLWNISMTIEEVFLIAQREGIHLYDIQQNQMNVSFYADVIQRNRVSSAFLRAKKIKTTGMIGFCFMKMKSRLFLISCIFMILIWFFFQHLTLKYEIIGQGEDIQTLIETELEKFPLPSWSMNSNADEIQAHLQTKLMDELSWLDVYQEGSVIKLMFSRRKQTDFEIFQSVPLYATKSAIVSHFEVQHGNKLVKEHDFVQVGTLLVDSILLDSQEMTHELFVKGKVFGYTWYQIEASMSKEESIHEGLSFFRLLMECRSQIGHYLDPGEKLIKETILQFQQNEGTIQLKVHYTLLEDITLP